MEADVSCCYAQIVNLRFKPDICPNYMRTCYGVVNNLYTHI